MTTLPHQWTSIEELASDPGFAEKIAAEFPVAASFPPTARRDFLKIMAASFALAGLTGCEKSPFVAGIPYVDQPEAALPGVPRYYATAVTLDGYAQPVLATTYDGRPTKLDGLPGHPATQGRSDVFMQAAVLQLYDPDRAQSPTRTGEPVTWTDVGAMFTEQRRDWQQDGGKRLRLLLSQTTSPTLTRQIKEFQSQFPAARLHVHDVSGERERIADGVAAYGEPLDLHYQLKACAVVVSFDDDFLGPGPRQLSNAIKWTQARRRGDAPGIRLYCAESIPAATGAVASSRLRAAPSRMPHLVEALAARLGVAEASAADLSEEERRWLTRAVAAINAANGRVLVTAGLGIGAQAARWTAQINDAIGATGRTLKLTSPVADPGIATASFDDLVTDMNAGQVDALVILDANPVYTAPGSLDFAGALSKVKTSIHIGLYRDETGHRCTYQLPLTHDLESWSDARAVDGTATIIQPVMTPFYDVRSRHQIMAIMLGRDEAADLSVKTTWRDAFGESFDAKWTKALRDGFVTASASEVQAKPASGKIEPTASDADGSDIVFRLDPTLWDGRYANLGWLQELPKPLSTLTWGNVIAVSPAWARDADAENGDMLELDIDGRKLSGPAWIMPGQADNTFGLWLGHGRKQAGRVGNGVGYDAYHVRPAATPWLTRGLVRKLDRNESLAVTQLHHRMEGFDLVREVSHVSPTLPAPAPRPSLYSAKPSAKNAWGMVIDIDSCIGCNACVAACTAENNVAVVGKTQVEMGRDMHWLRIARYYTGDVENPRSYFQPVPCMQCEDAPCEMGCPVHATTHSPEGINQMVYNRCIGTRTCSSYCPYKVRRFNYLDYRNTPVAPAEPAHNPDVTLRSRGVMEKCTYCTQRIQAAHVAADKDNRDLRDGDVVTACQAACPTRAIVFGDINDPNSEVSKLRRSGRHYALLEELGTRPRTTYLAKWNDGSDTEDDRT
jgi:molybdopterin-containing oxidoreductase family iron-sulfur binding subunit